VVPTDVAQAVVEVEPFVLPVGADAEVGGEPTVAASTADTAGGLGEEDGTPPYTSVGTIG
jgi:hypothetical protein